MSVKFVENSLTFSVDFGEFIAVPEGDAEHYLGEYVVTPDPEGKTLETAGKLMNDDVTIKAIPYHDVSNNSGGRTVYIGKEIE